MFGTLIESRRKRTRQYGYTIMSATAHLTVLAGAVGATSARMADPAPERPPIETLYFDVSHRRPAPTTPPAPGGTPQRVVVGPDIRIAMPDFTRIPIEIPPVGVELGSVLPPARGSDPGVRPQGLTPGSDPHGYLGGGSGPVGDAPWSAMQVERPAALAAPLRPRFPETLRSAGIGGIVRVRMIIDTLGRVEPGSIEVRESAHDLFERAVRDVLATARFRPATVARRPVRQLVEMPFVFDLR